MGIFRKITAIFVIAVIALAAVPANAAVELKYAEDQTMTLMYSTEATSLCAFGASASANDWQAVSNCVEGLMTVDKYGKLLPGLAESYEVSDDAMTYTFHIREGLKWVNVKGEPMGDLTAHDFVAVARFTLEPERASPNALYFENVIQGAKEFLAGETDDFDIVAFVALDDYTLQISLVGPLPYFLSYCGSYQPAYAPLLEELGDNYGIDNETMYYVGAYIMTVFEPQYRRVYEKNPDYYNADEVFIEKVTMLYNAEYYTIGPELFLRGEIDYAQIDTAILDEWKKNDATKNIVIPSLPDTTYMYYYGFNYDPNFDEQYEPENWRLAVNNENFRQSLYWAINREKALLCQDPYNPQMQFTNSITPIGCAFVDGVDFTQIGPMAEITARPNQQFDGEKALAYKEKAVEELTAAGATFPIKVLMPYNPVLSSWENEVQVVKQQITELLGEDYRACPFGVSSVAKHPTFLRPCSMYLPY